MSNKLQIYPFPVFQPILIKSLINFANLGRPFEWSKTTEPMTDHDRRLQEEVKGWLRDIASGEETKRENVSIIVADIIGANPDLMKMSVGFLGKERLFNFGFNVGSTKAILTFATAMILDRNFQLTNRLGQCGAPGCGRFNFTFKGKPRRHCNEDHLIMANEKDAARRMRELRNRIQLAKKKEEKNHGKKTKSK